MLNAVICSPRKTGGAALLEALIAVTLLSVGMFGNMRLLSEATAQLTQILYQQRALNINADLITLINSLPPNVSVADMAAAEHNCATATPCDAAAFYANSLHHWQQKIAATLPAGLAQIHTRTANGTVTLELRINWRSPDPDSPFSLSTYAFRVQS